MDTPFIVSSFRGEYFFLSNFSPFEFTWDGVDYPTLEHIYQASKTEDLTLRRDIARAGTPGKAKRLGRSVPLRPDWDRIKLKVMHELLLIKFGNTNKFYPEMRDKLLATGDAMLIEGNNYGDTYWGVCMGAGHNMLGALLMLVRSEIS